MRRWNAALLSASLVFISLGAPARADGGGSVTSSLSATDLAECSGTSTVTLTITGVQPSPGQVPVDVMLVLDKSGSMGGTPINDLKTAANGFVTTMDHYDGTVDGNIATSRVGMVSFNQTPTLDAALTHSAASVHSQINALVAGGNTNIGGAVQMGASALSASSAKKVEILMTDGQSNTGPDPLTAATAAKASGIELFTIGLGSGVNVAELTAMATDAHHFYLAPTSSQLSSVFQQIATGVAGPAASSLTYAVHPAQGWQITGATATKGTVTTSPSSLGWSLNELLSETVTVTYTMQHVGPTGGNTTLADAAVLSYTDSDGSPATADYAHTTVNVPGCNQPPTANAGPDQTVPQDTTGYATVTLDGSGSTDDGQIQPLSYQWMEGAATLGTGAVITHTFGLGTHTITLTVSDGQYSASDTTTVTVTDPFPPATTASVTGTAGQNGWYTSPVTVSLSAADNPGGSGVQSTVYSVDGGATTAYAGPFTVTGDGTHSVSFHSTDNAGNVEPDGQVAVKIDTTAPVITVTSPLAQAYGDDATPTVSWTAADALSGLAGSSATLDGSPISNGAVLDLSSLGLGTHTLVVTATDKAGNASTVTVSFQVAVTFDSLSALKHHFYEMGLIKNQGIVTSLDQKLRAAAAAHDRGQFDTEDNILRAFIAEVNAQAGKGIFEPAVTVLLRDAQWLMAHH